MSREIMSVWARQGEKRYSVDVIASTDQERTVLVRSRHWPEVRGVGSDLFDALASARESLEQIGVTLECNGSRVDVYPSSMLRQMAGGRRAYVLAIPRTAMKPDVVDIFEAPPTDAMLVSVTKQREWFEKWLSS